MEISLFLAKILGLTGAISTLLIILNYKKHIAMETETVKNSSSVYTSGFVFIIMGVLITVSHQVWTNDWRLIITILGWMLLLKGVMRITMTEHVIKLIEKKKNNKGFLIAEVFTFLVSCYLILKGYYLC